MRKLRLTFSVLTAVVIMLFASCGDGSTETKTKTDGDHNDTNTEEVVSASILGSWTVTKGEGFAADGEVGSKYVFDADGGLAMGEGANTLTTTYEMKEGKLITASSIPDIFYTWETELTETELIISNEDKNQKLWLTKD